MSPLLFSGDLLSEKMGGLVVGAGTLLEPPSGLATLALPQGTREDFGDQVEAGRETEGNCSISPNSSRIRPWAGAGKAAEPKDWRTGGPAVGSEADPFPSHPPFSNPSSAPGWRGGTLYKFL